MDGWMDAYCLLAWRWVECRYVLRPIFICPENELNERKKKKKTHRAKNNINALRLGYGCWLRWMRKCIYVLLSVHVTDTSIDPVCTHSRWTMWILCVICTKYVHIFYILFVNAQSVLTKHTQYLSPSPRDASTFSHLSLHLHLLHLEYFTHTRGLWMCVVHTDAQSATIPTKMDSNNTPNAEALISLNAKIFLFHYFQYESLSSSNRRVIRRVGHTVS